jgi:outer membrane lipoprotein-sorting protein
MVQKTTLTIDQFKSNQKISDELFQFDQNSYEKLGYLID